LAVRAPAAVLDCHRAIPVRARFTGGFRRDLWYLCIGQTSRAFSTRLSEESHGVESRAAGDPGLSRMQGRSGVRRVREHAHLSGLPAALPGGGRHPGHAGGRGREALSPGVTFPRVRPAFPRPRLAATALLALALLPLRVLAAPRDGVRLAPATPGAVRFTVQVPPPTFTRVDSARGLLRVNVAGYGLASDDPAAPALPSRTLLVAVPALG